MYFRLIGIDQIEYIASSFISCTNNESFYKQRLHYEKSYKLKRKLEAVLPRGKAFLRMCGVEKRYESRYFL